MSTAALSLRIGHLGLVLAAAGLLTAKLLLILRDRAPLVVAMLVFFIEMCSGFTLHEHVERLAERLDQPAVVALALVLALLASGYALLRVLPRAGDAHWAWHARLVTPSWAGSGGLWHWRPGAAPSVRRFTTPGTAAAMAMLQALGPKLHASAYIVVALMVATLTALLLAQRYGEQALYRLAPGAPAVAVFNRVRARALLTRFLVLWLVAFGCALTLMREMWPGIGNHAVAPLLAAATLPFAGALLTNVAALRTALSPARTFASAVGLLGAYGFVLSVTGKSHDFPWFALSAVIGVASLVFLRWRWLRMITMAPAFPAGRMAS